MLRTETEKTMDLTMAESGNIMPDHYVDLAAIFGMLPQTKASTEEIVEKILAIKKEGQPKFQLRELVTQVLLNFVTFRQVNRSILLEEDRVMAETESAKAPVKSSTLQLHNLMYEKNQYVKAIKAFEDFKTKYSDIELAPKEEFLKDAPEEMKTISLTSDSTHDLMLKRLNYELFQRKELCTLRHKLELQKKALQEAVSNRKKFLTNLPSQLKALKKASLPVENQLGNLHSKTLKQEHLAELLPAPLYIIYSQLLAQKEAFEENIELEIEGNVKDAQIFARWLANKHSAITSGFEDSMVKIDVCDVPDGGQSGIYQSHPLKVCLHINDGELLDLNSTKLVTVKFEFLIKLNAVCVGVEDSGEEDPQDDILCNLFPDDHGLELPQQSAKLCIGSSLSFDERRTSRPYRWAQHLAGIEFFPEVSPLLSFSGNSNGENTRHGPILSGLTLYRQQNRAQTVVQRIRSRVKTKLSLA